MEKKGRMNSVIDIVLFSHRYCPDMATARFREAMEERKVLRSRVIGYKDDFL